jgi:hypothetical protein
VVSFQSSSCLLPDPVIAGPFAFALTTMAFDQSRRRWFGIRSCKPIAEGPSLIGKAVTRDFPFSSFSRSWHCDRLH